MSIGVSHKAILADALSKLVLDDLAALHDQGQVAPGIAQHRDVFERLAVNQQQVGNPAFADLAEIAEAIGRVLAEQIRSPRDVPPFRNSAMDGYAVCAADCPAEGLSLPVSQRIPAGASPQPLVAGTAARIFTGAPIPAGADAVVMQEVCEATDGAVVIHAPVEAGSNIRRRGEDIRNGDVVVAAGTRLLPQHLGLAASVGVAELAAELKQELMTNPGIGNLDLLLQLPGTCVFCKPCCFEKRDAWVAVGVGFHQPCQIHGVSGGHSP